MIKTLLLTVSLLISSAAVALLKSVGASHGITYLIIGESLMNDGTALVLYGLFSTLVKMDAGPVFSIIDVAIYFLRVIFISPLLGFGFGLCSVLFLAYVHVPIELIFHIAI